ncbi:MAG: hypothetical protein OEV28_04515 [Nitrospirota bacterium]|nr:hypothetical protein [Nitrospirota bacterium]
MTDILLFLNNYFHDLATAILFVCGYTMFVMFGKAEKRGTRESMILFLEVYPRLVHLNAGALIFVIMAGIVRTFTYEEFESQSALGQAEVPVLMLKHVLLGGLTFYGIWLWIKVHRKVMKVRKEIGAGGGFHDVPSAPSSQGGENR